MLVVYDGRRKVERKRRGAAAKVDLGWGMAAGEERARRGDLREGWRGCDGRRAETWD